MEGTPHLSIISERDNSPKLTANEMLSSFFRNDSKSSRKGMKTIIYSTMKQFIFLQIQATKNEDFRQNYYLQQRVRLRNSDPGNLNTFYFTPFFLIMMLKTHVSKVIRVSCEKLCLSPPAGLTFHKKYTRLEDVQASSRKTKIEGAKPLLQCSRVYPVHSPSPWNWTRCLSTVNTRV